MDITNFTQKNEQTAWVELLENNKRTDYFSPFLIMMIA